MRLLRRVALALLLSAAAGGAQDEERLPGWKGEVTRSTGAVKERWIEPIAWHPRAFLFHGFLSAAECEHIKDTARPRMERSMVVDPVTGGEKLDDIRTSFGTFLRRGETDMIRDIEQRVAEWSQVPAANGEQLQVLRYGLGQQYNDHWDWFDKKTLEVDPLKNSQRVATVLMFLSEVEEGGETVFPMKSEWADSASAALAANFSDCAKRGPAVKPQTGDAILFWSLDLTGVEDEGSMHASCPVTRGEKWTATKWLHTALFKAGAESLPNTCEDSQPSCEGWATDKQCKDNAGFMLGSHGFGGACVRSCCLPEPRPGVPEAACAVCAGTS